MSNKEKELPQTLSRWNVPDDWKWVSITDVSKVVTGNTPPTSDKANYGNDVPYVKPPELIDRGIRITPSGLSTKGAAIARTLPAGAVLVSCIGGLGKTGIAKVPVAFNQQINAVVFNENIIPEYGFYYMQTLKEWLYSVSSATTLPIVNKSKFQRAPFPVAPLEQQKRIVAEIEKQFSRLDEAVTNLKRVKANLKRYKAAVLKAAVEGKLTEEWRKKNPDVEPADKLLERIIAERRANWQGRGKYKEPVVPDTSGLPELPVGWVWTNFSQLAEAIPNAIKAGPFGSALKKSFYVSDGYKIYGQEQVIREDPYYGDYYIDEQKYQNLLSCAVKPGDLLISLVGTIGRVLILPDDIDPGIINPRLVKISLDRKLVNPSFISTYLQSTYVKTLFTIASHGGTMDILNLGILKEIPIPLPPIEEQLMLLAEFERIASIESGLIFEIEKNQVRADRLRQTILKQAFSGQLVPQDENDEPASEMLDRIRNDVGANNHSPQTTPKTQKRANINSPLRKPQQSPAPEPLPLVAESNATYGDAITARILAAMQPDREYARADLVELLGLTTGQWNAAILELKLRGQVQKVEEKRGARYELVRAEGGGR